MFQMLGSWAPKIEVSKHRRKKRKKSKRGGGVCGQAFKDTVRKKASISYMGKGTEVL